MEEKKIQLRLNLLNTQGKNVDFLELDKNIFDGKINQQLMHQAIVTYLSNKRKFLASTKTRGEVRGGGKKPWRQKGTGRARVGSIRSPLWRGGGIVFGPKPHLAYKKMPQRMKIMALKSALNAKLLDNEIILLEDLKVNSHKTKEFVNIIKNLKLDEKKKNRFVVDVIDRNLKLSSQNLKKIELTTSKNLNTYEALDCKNLIFTKNSLEEIQNRIIKWLK